MKMTWGLLTAAGALALAACTETAGTEPVPSGGSAGAQGPGYCDSVPADPEDLANWNELCGEQDR